mmetsp:Transcript_885/g.2625  ORF Transcript_885/g.2625 Transcript_885/m.2625 type:complete len:140 (-) Transcript_885:127-546(-)
MAGTGDVAGRAAKRARTDADAPPGAAAAPASAGSGGVKLKFRNYVPSGDELADKVLALSDETPSIDEAVKLAQEKMAVETVERTGSAPDDDVDLLNLAPQKIDWDLKRDIAPKLEKLERRTQRAIAELINERLAAEQKE